MVGMVLMVVIVLMVLRFLMVGWSGLAYGRTMGGRATSLRPIIAHARTRGNCFRAESWQNPCHATLSGAWRGGVNPLRA